MYEGMAKVHSLCWADEGWRMQEGQRGGFAAHQSLIWDMSRMESTMPKESHIKAAEHHENAAKSHRNAAESHGRGDHEQGFDHSTQAHENSTRAHQSSNDAHERSKTIRSEAGSKGGKSTYSEDHVRAGSPSHKSNCR
jgi:hypothetical protein